MKKVIVVSKTHLDLGFTDYAANIEQKYIDTYIPNAIRTAETVNTGAKKSFIWTTGSWILKEAIEKGSVKQQYLLKEAIKNGNISYHAMPFTTHTELLDEETLDYGLSIADKLDKLKGRKTTAAKVTDVPRHTKGLVKMLAKHGIKLLHIGVNGASALPDVPECFLWKDDEYEVIIIYSGAYGGAFKCEYTEEILYFDHTLDNKGTPTRSETEKTLKRIENENPGYVAEAGTLDEYADIIWEKRHELPVFEGELGDTWIHGAATDPYKSAALRELMSLKRKWLAEGSMFRSSAEYIGFSDALLCIAEHTCGVDSKIFLHDHSHYLKKAFNKARKGRLKSRYDAIEKSWLEQRMYILNAVNSLQPEHKAEAEKALSGLIPKTPKDITDFTEYDNSIITVGDWQFRMNKNGGIGLIRNKDTVVIKENNDSAVEYRAFDHTDYDYWFKHYSRDLEHTTHWASDDFGRPGLEKYSGKYLSGRFAYSLKKAVWLDDHTVCAELATDIKLVSEQGAPSVIQIIYTLGADGLSVEVSWFGKEKNRLTEAVYLHMYPAEGKFTLHKLGRDTEYDSVASMGGRNLHAVEYCKLNKNGSSYIFTNKHSPLVSIGKGKILEFDNKFEDINRDGVTYVLYDNVWGTNFPLWYKNNAYFKFEITEENKDA